jgi:septal ring factor EnvC (AmiA/AmiB activator)
MKIMRMKPCPARQIAAGLAVVVVAGCGGAQTQQLEARLEVAKEQYAKTNQELQKLHHLMQQKDIELEGLSNSLQKAQAALQEKSAELEMARRTIQDKEQQLAQRSMTPTYTYTPPPSKAKTSKKKSKKK